MQGNERSFTGLHAFHSVLAVSGCGSTNSDFHKTLRHSAACVSSPLLGLDGRIGRLAAGFAADLVHLTEALDVAGVWVDGKGVQEADERA